MSRLIGTSMSRRGWSFYEKDAHCPALPFAVRQSGIGGGFDSSAPALVKGSLGHVMQAHHLAREEIAATGSVIIAGETATNEDDWLPPEDAAEEYCRENDDYRFLDEMIETFRAHRAQRPYPLGRTIAVETEHSGVIGTKDGRWGYWVVDPLHADFLQTPVVDHPIGGLMAVDGGTIVCDPLQVEGHRENGYPVWMSRRDDADIEVPTRGVLIVDHKHKGYVNVKEIVSEYSLEDGMCAFRHIGSQVYGSAFGGVAVHAIQVGNGFTVFKELKAFPEHDRLFAQRLWTRAHEMFQRQLHSDGSEYKGWRGGKSNCIRFGRPCDGFKFCYGTDDI